MEKKVKFYPVGFGGTETTMPLHIWGKVKFIFLNLFDFTLLFYNTFVLILI